MKLAKTPTWRQRTAIVACAAAIAGCAQCPPFRSAWYLDTTSPNASGVASIWLALLNEGTQPLKVKQLVLNPPDKDAAGTVVLKGVTLQPGRLWLVHLDRELLDVCQVPVAVRLECANGASRTQPVAGLLPNYLPDFWTNVCSMTRPGDALEPI
jgi:hypothetical protein